MTIFNVFSLLGGLALFLFGMDIMGKALEKQAGGQLFQCFAHNVHAEQEQGKTSKQGKDIEDGHKDFLTFV